MTALRPTSRPWLRRYAAAKRYKKLTPKEQAARDLRKAQQEAKAEREAYRRALDQRETYVYRDDFFLGKVRLALRMPHGNMRDAMKLADDDYRKLLAMTEDQLMKLDNAVVEDALGRLADRVNDDIGKLLAARAGLHRITKLNRTAAALRRERERA